jgi:hypothetical protein
MDQNMLLLEKRKKQESNKRKSQSALNHAWFSRVGISDPTTKEMENVQFEAGFNNWPVILCKHYLLMVYLFKRNE